MDDYTFQIEPTAEDIVIILDNYGKRIGVLQGNNGIQFMHNIEHTIEEVDSSTELIKSYEETITNLEAQLEEYQEGKPSFDVRNKLKHITAMLDGLMFLEVKKYIKEWEEGV